MARARNIKPSFFKNEDLAELGMSTRLMFIGLWCLADREGRLEDRPKRIKMELFPGDDVNVEKGLAELHRSGFIERYEVDGSRYINIPTFLKHQNPHHREVPSTIPKPEAGTQLQLPISLGHEPHGTAHKPEASPGPAQGEAQPGQVPAVLNPDSLIPDSGILNPESPSLNPDPLQLLADAPAAPGRQKRSNGEGKTVETWNAFSQAYRERYEIDPIRNAKVNGQLAKLVDQVGIEEAPKVAAFYLTHNGQLYVSSGHAVDLLLRDCQKLRTEMVTGRRITRSEAKQAETKDAVREQAARVGRLLGQTP